MPISVNFANSLNYKELSDALLINVEFQHFFSKCDAPKIHFCRFSFSELLSSLRISLDFVKCKTKYILMYPIFPSIITTRLQYLKPTALLLLYNIESLHLVPQVCYLLLQPIVYIRYCLTVLVEYIHDVSTLLYHLLPRIISL